MLFQQDLETIDRMIATGEVTYNKWRHPDPYVGKCLLEGLFINIYV